ncbi:hypothetical protein GMES_3194 [Paraglaciecola mesophila KMM 241]|uniref:Uncharacterized protein n=1 Tax=Paraglaciecola mesophila KMM 241 TaxID=1128912 RepID=K6Z519_9ALTE|nr:hypothetical protein GMES_3194 [Paraglaciecola mesophila KMM 241]
MAKPTISIIPLPFLTRDCLFAHGYFSLTAVFCSRPLLALGCKEFVTLAQLATT